MWLVFWPAPLNRSFQAILFDWDGTAVHDRNEKAVDLAEALSRLLERGVVIVIVCGTHLNHLERQILSFLPKRGLQNLFLATNRGSEVYGFSPSATVELLDRRTAAVEERGALDRSAQAVQRLLWEDFHLASEVILDRLNRVKIDLLPVPEWQNPAKTQARELAAALEKRLGVQEGMSGLPWLMKRAREISQELGLRDPRVTTDLKYLEIGLTDKSDSARWFFETVLKKRGLLPDQVILCGDEWGARLGAAGSDSYLRIPELTQAACLSVGIDPEGVPSGVLHVSGGPEAFLEFIDLQVALSGWGHSEDPDWNVEQEVFDATREREMESLFAVSNGNIGLRGSLEISLPSSEADLFLAGVYDAKSPVRPYSEIDFLASDRERQAFAEIASLPFPLKMKLRIEGVSLEIREGSEPRISRKLDLNTGILRVHQEFESSFGRLSLRSLRAASLDHPECLLHEVQLFSGDQDLSVEFELGVDLHDLSLRHPHLELLKSEPDWQILQTRLSRFLIGIHTKAEINGIELVGGRWSGRLVRRKPIQVRRVISVWSSQDSAERFHVDMIKNSAKINVFDFHRMIGAHRRKWRKFWTTADFLFTENRSLTESQRFNAYHLRSAAPISDKTSIPARALSGRGYEGHVFWDAEIFMLPYFALQFPEAAKKMLQYRYTTLEGARARAREMGYLGACYAWESTVDGSDVTPSRLILKTTGQEIPIYTGNQQIHVTADVAYGVWNYWNCSGDGEFMREQGAEILFETARFWASRCSLEIDHYHLNGVVGPDEYHHDVRDNAYTNRMAQFNLEKALWVRDWLAVSDPVRFVYLSQKMRLDEDEFSRWQDVAQKIFIPNPRPDGVIEQFQGFFQLEKRALSQKDRLKAPVERLLDWRQVNQTQICKQADVLMLFVLFPEEFSLEVMKANFEFYEPITDHGSSLSPPIHALVAAKIGKKEEALFYYLKSVELDLTNLMKNTSLGIHAACMGASWQALLFGFLGVKLLDSGPIVSPRVGSVLPTEWGKLQFKLWFRGKFYELEASAA